MQKAGKPQTLTQGKQIAIRATLDGSSSVDIANAPLVFVCYGVKAPERGWDDFKGVELKGKIAVVLINAPDFETDTGAFDGAGMTYYGRWTDKYEECARQGALGVLVVHETAPASYGWDQTCRLLCGIHAAQEPATVSGQGPVGSVGVQGCKRCTTCMSGGCRHGASMDGCTGVSRERRGQRAAD